MMKTHLYFSQLKKKTDYNNFCFKLCLSSVGTFADLQYSTIYLYNNDYDECTQSILIWIPQIS